MSAAERLLPRPLSLEERPGEYVLRPGARIHASAGAAGVAGWLRGQLLAATGYGLDGDDPGIRLDWDGSLGDEEYCLSVAPGGVRVRAGGAAGLAHGAQTLLQLVPRRRLPRGCPARRVLGGAGVRGPGRGRVPLARGDAGCCAALPAET
ncbi:hypothetical protein ATY41_03485 [Leifsonia xyli subsp. xyli]|uniref:Beta-hexosaminidase bacterial type N-terminal domain-containing protein n=1 Tax=Leifsonia xyli subsp. xyli TaxID=59736 RepID=A0A1E2SJ09_LEIXY|nr:glycoside hydrolase family 20 zincin-like fold domain-containing protein [Leifsonia xyli]ODA89743.1 hypothetical protein ATY41_03485 [Leifsonia xyli subsp. xyli]